MDEEEQLKNWLETCQTASTPLARQKAMTRLLIHIQNSPDLYRVSHQNYLEALNLTLIKVNKNIGSFTPQPPSVSTSLMRWVNSYLRWRIRSLYISNRQRSISLNTLISASEGSQTTLEEIIAPPDEFRRLELLEQQIELIQEAELQQIGKTIEEYIEQDPAGFLTSCHPRNHPKWNGQELARRILLSQSPETIRTIAQEAGISEQTLHTHWREKCKPRIRIIALRFDLELREAIENPDARNALEACNFGNQPNCNCLELVERMVFADAIEDVRSIARDFSMNQSEVWDHWENQCLPLLRKYRFNLDT